MLLEIARHDCFVVITGVFRKRLLETAEERDFIERDTDCSGLLEKRFLD